MENHTPFLTNHQTAFFRSSWAPGSSGRRRHRRPAPPAHLQLKHVAWPVSWIHIYIYIYIYMVINLFHYVLIYLCIYLFIIYLYIYLFVFIYIYIYIYICHIYILWLSGAPQKEDPLEMALQGSSLLTPIGIGGRPYGPRDQRNITRPRPPKGLPFYLQ